MTGPVRGQGGHPHPRYSHLRGNQPQGPMRSRATLGWASKADPPTSQSTCKAEAQVSHVRASTVGEGHHVMVECSPTACSQEKP